MDFLSLLLLVLPFLWICIHLLTTSLGSRKYGHGTLPPGPRPFPIIGNIFQLGNKPHQGVANLSKTYGPLMTLKLGSITTIVISSPHTAKEALHKHDHALSSRTIPNNVQALGDHHKHSIVWLPVSDHWKNLRKICAVQLFSSQQLDASQALRRKKVQELLDHVRESCSGGHDVEIGRAALTTVLNLMSNTFFSIDLAHYNSNLSQKFKELVWGSLEEAGKPCLSNYFPALRLIDPQGNLQQLKNYYEQLLQIFHGIINERTKLSDSSMTSKASNDVLDSLLNLAKENISDWSTLDIKHLLVDLFVAGTDTSSSTVEWAMAELLHNPEKMEKAKNELKEVLGKNGLVQESDISKLPYLQAIVKETLRLHPPAPFLVPHKAQLDVEIGGFIVPKNAQVLVNVWAMGRDSSIWPNPNSFVPERFLESEIDLKGRYFELIPFGAGRRICPGLPLAHRMVHLMLASLIYSFDWKLEDGLKPENMDMSEKYGLTLHKAEPLRAIPIKV